MKLTKWQSPIMVTGYLFKSAALIGLLGNLAKIHPQKKRWILTNSFIAALRILNISYSEELATQPSECLPSLILQT